MARNNFVRVPKSYLVAIDQIDSIERLVIRMGEARIPIGKTYQERFFGLLGKKGVL